MEGACETKIRAPQGHHSYFYSCILKTVRGYFAWKISSMFKQLNEMCLKLYFGWYYTAVPGWIVYQSLCLSKTSLNLNYNGISNELFLTERKMAEGQEILKLWASLCLIKGRPSKRRKISFLTNTMPKYLIL